jgi:site-specific DNA-methyltransferase (adenine-specific)
VQVLIHGECLAFLKSEIDNKYDSLITDPPAGISFMGKAWDDNKGGRDQWITWLTEVMTECKRVLKPGAHGLVWALPRTSHWTATALENAGFEIRDVVTHLFGSGFPKSMDISKAIDKAAGAERVVLGRKTFADGTQTRATAGKGDKFVVTGNSGLETAPATDAAIKWQGYGTALKPASEHWILIRKPLSEKTVAANVLKHGTGGINIDGCRIEASKDYGRSSARSDGITNNGEFFSGLASNKEASEYASPLGRFPANLVLDEIAAEMLDEQSGVLKSGSLEEHHVRTTSKTKNSFGERAAPKEIRKGDSVGASRFFYVAKASKSDKGADNTHPTVKSTKLMGYLIKLVTPEGGTVLDPFMGSGSTGVAAKKEGFDFTGIEQDSNYFEIAKKRIETNGVF